jgi:hypothetical protein
MGEFMTVRGLMMVVTAAGLCVFALMTAACDSGADPTSSSSQPTSSTVRPQTAATMPSTTTSPEQSTATTGASQLYPVSVGGKWGYIDNTGTIKIQPHFDLAGDFSEGLAKVAMGDGPAQKWGFIDKTGALVVDPRFGNAGDFSDGLASVAEPGDSKPGGYIDTSGTLVIPMEYEGGSGFAEGLALVFVPGGGCAFIDRTGATVLGPYDYAWPFSGGLAYAEKTGRRGFINASGNWVVELDSAELGVRDNFSDGLALIEAPVPADAAHPGGIHFGFIDTSGAVSIEPQFDLALGFSEGLAAAAEYSGAPGDGIGSVDYRHGFIDKTGAWVIPPQYAEAGPFSEGLAMVGAISEGKLLRGYIDKSGTVVIPLQYEVINAHPFTWGLARLDNGENTSPTYIDKTGKVIWQGN